MANPTVSDIIEILKQGTYVGNLTQIRSGDQPFHLYPSIEVTQSQPLSPTTDPMLKTSEAMFQVQIFVRYSRKIVLEKDLLRQNELEVQRVLNLQPLQDGEFFFQSETWDRSETKDVHGVISTFRVMYREIVGTEPGTVVGGGSFLEIGGVTLELIGTANQDDGINHSELWDDGAKRFPIPDGDVGMRMWEYAWTMTLYNQIQAIVDARAYVPAKFVESNGDEENLSVLAVRQRVQQTFAGLKTSTLQMEIKS